MDVVRDGIRVGQGMKRGMHGKVLAGFGARLQLTLTTSTLTASARRRACLTSICMWAAGGRWELAAATGRGEAQAGATGSVGTAGGLVVHGGAGGAATVRDQARGAAPGPQTQPRRGSRESWVFDGFARARWVFEITFYMQQ